jgi:predicted aspartyl protease
MRDGEGIMELNTMGKVAVPARIENLEDVFNVAQGNLGPEQVRAIEVSDALVDTGALFLSVPRRYIQQLELHHFRNRKARTTNGVREFGMYGMARLLVLGRDCYVEVAEVPEDCPVLIGQVPLGMLDFVVDPVNQRLIGNPDHGGEQMFDMF